MTGAAPIAPVLLVGFAWRTEVSLLTVPGIVAVRPFTP